MPRKLALLILLLSASAAAQAQILDPFYHTNAEIYEQIVGRQQQYPDTVRVDTIGYSHQDHLPIWAVKLSDHVQLDEDEPTILFVGQVHAEEILGVEITLALMDTLLNKRFQTPYYIWLRDLEIWLVPTMNPEGHQVVMDEWDIAYRKNKHDLDLNSFFNFQPGMGGDSDGVDINRNFSLNWVHGDGYLQPGTEEQYDYFRGFYPFSETETQALWDLGSREKFSFSVVWHSSRSGANAERVFYPWDWDDSGKHPPDFTVLDSTVIGVASSISKLSGSGTYNYFPSDAPRGNQHDSFYASLGTLAFLIECGNANLQPPAATAQQVITANLPAAYYLMNRAVGYGDNMAHAQITGNVTDASGNPLPAIVTIPQLDGPYLTPRACDPSFGRYRRYVNYGTFDLRVSLRGYYPQTATVVANPSGKVVRNFALQSKPTYLFHGLLLELNGDPISGTLFLRGEDVADTVLIGSDGAFAHLLPEGEYQLIFDSPGLVVRFDQISLDQNRYVTFELSPGQTLFADDFAAGLSLWTHGGTNDLWGTEYADSLWPGGLVATESPDSAYRSGTQSWLELNAPLDLTEYRTASLRFQHWYYFEPGYDHGLVQASSDGGATWDTLCGLYNQQDIGWGVAYGSLDAYCGLAGVRLRWLASTDESLQEQGWRLDEVLILASDTLTAVDPSASQVPSGYALLSLYPNPFNGQIAIMISLPQAQALDLSLWDLAGRKVAAIESGMFAAGDHRLSWQMPRSQASGLYFLRSKTEQKTEFRKVLFLK